MKNKLFQLFSILFICVLQSCSTPKNLTLSNTRWDLDEVKGVVIDYLIVNPQNTNVYITFDQTKSRFSGSTGCNTIGGKAVVEGNKMTFSEMISTQMVCSNIKAEKTYLSLLESVDNYKMKGKKLSLYQGDKLLATYLLSKKSVDTLVKPAK